MHTDPISDMLTRIRNAQAVKKTEVVLPYSRLKMAILDLLVKEGWLNAAKKITPDSYKDNINADKKEKIVRFDRLEIKIKYNNDGTSKIDSLKRVSKPGRRVYVDKDNIPVVLNHLGMAVISTSQGLMTDKEAKKKKVGGEVICEIY
ncbi:MAG: 30S ribosomal protein S8 [Candidatus Kuenenbacteria bacterium]